MKSLAFVLFLTTALKYVSSNSRDQERADDGGPLETLVMKLSSDMSKMSAEFSLLKTELSDLKAKFEVEKRHVAFLAQFSTREQTTPASGPFKFDHVIFNDGDHYDPSLGIFTAPYPGGYVFSAKFFTDGTQAAHPVLDVKVNGNTQDRMSFGEPGLEGGVQQSSHSTSMMLRLRAGDRVWVESYNSRVYKLYGIFHTFFSGALLYSE